MPKALFTRADFDIPTTYLSSYASKLIDFATQNGYEVVDLYNDDSKNPALPLRFEEEMDKTPKPDVLIGAGHGNEKIFTGQDLEVLLKVGVNDDITSGTKTYLWSCLTGVQLGPQMVSKTCPEFYGYLADYTFIYHPDYENTPLDDPYAKAFFDSGLATGYALLLGKPPDEVYKLTIERYNY